MTDHDEDGENASCHERSDSSDDDKSSSQLSTVSLLSSSSSMDASGSLDSRTATKHQQGSKALCLDGFFFSVVGTSVAGGRPRQCRGGKDSSPAALEGIRRPT